MKFLRVGFEFEQNFEENLCLIEILEKLSAINFEKFDFEQNFICVSQNCKNFL